MIGSDQRIDNDISNNLNPEVDLIDGLLNKLAIITDEPENIDLKSKDKTPEVKIKKGVITDSFGSGIIGNLLKIVKKRITTKLVYKDAYEFRSVMKPFVDAEEQADKELKKDQVIILITRLLIF